MIADVFGNLSPEFLKLYGNIRKFFFTFHYSRTITNLAQFHQALQDSKLRSLYTLLFNNTQYFFTEIVSECIINFALLLIHFTEKYHLRFFGKILRHLLFCSSKNEGIQ